MSTAERQLNEGSREEALATFADHERRFPHGALTEARIAARIEALCMLGRMAYQGFNTNMTTLIGGSVTLSVLSHMS